jgi:hypothetical protein
MPVARLQIDQWAPLDFGRAELACASIMGYYCERVVIYHLQKLSQVQCLVHNCLAAQFSCAQLSGVQLFCAQTVCSPCGCETPCAKVECLHWHAPSPIASWFACCVVAAACVICRVVAQHCQCMCHAVSPVLPCVCLAC